MDQGVGVGVGQSGQHVLADLDELLSAQASPKWRQRSAGHVLHHQVGRAISDLLAQAVADLDLALIQQAHDVPVTQTCCSPRLNPEAGEALRICSDVPREHLDGDNMAGIGLASPPDHRAGACPQSGDQYIWAKVHRSNPTRPRVRSP